MVLSSLPEVGAAFSREIIAHKCAPTQISNIFGWNLEIRI
jgi:hypothetical protein